MPITLPAHVEPGSPEHLNLLYLRWDGPVPEEEMRHYTAMRMRRDARLEEIAKEIGG